MRCNDSGRCKSSCPTNIERCNARGVAQHPTPRGPPVGRGRIKSAGGAGFDSPPGSNSECSEDLTFHNCSGRTAVKSSAFNIENIFKL